MLEAYIENSQKNIAIIADFSKSNSGNKSMLPAHSIKKWIEYTNKAIENFNKNTALASSSMLNSSVTKPDPIKTKT
jgi:hypothetical protein